jgi:cytochrome c peroxidase
MESNPLPDIPNGGVSHPPSDAPIVPETCTTTNFPSTGKAYPIVANKPVDIKTSLRNSVHAITWDGRVFIVTRGNPEPPHAQGWHISVFRPENLQRDQNGVVQFPDNAFSDQVLWEQDGTPDVNTNSHNTLTVFPAPDFPENPFPSDGDGNYNLGGGFGTYELYVISPGTDALEMGIRRGRFIIGNFKKNDAYVARVEMLGPQQLLRGTNNKPIRGLEPSITADGRLMVFQGSPKNDGGIDYIMYSYNDNPGSVAGWTPARSIADLYHVEYNRSVNGTPFHEVYPIAKQALRDASGKAYTKGMYYFGAYPWISHDGTEIFHTAMVAGCGPEDQRCPAFRRGDRAVRGAFSVIGRWTNWSMRLIDGPSNPQRDCIGEEPTIRTITNSLGAVPGMWAPFREVDNLAIPYTGNRPVYPLIGAVRSDYQEVSFEDFQDRDYIFYLRMNELLHRDPKESKRTKIVTNVTPDTSGNLLNAGLRGASFPMEYNGVDETVGAHGQAVYFPDGGSARIATTTRFNSIADGFTFEIFVKRLVNLAVDDQNRYRYLVHKPGSFNLIMEEGGQIIATVYLNVNGQSVERRSGPVGNPFNLGEWGHAAFTFDARSGVMKVYKDGQLVGQNQFERAQVALSNSDLVIGPGAQVPPAWPNATEALFILDEVKLSRVARNEQEIRVSAYVNGSRDTNQNFFNLPLGLRRSELRIPNSNPPNQRAIDLGQRLFHDARLSRNSDMSCATCHRPDAAFTDGFDRAHGFDGKILRRNTPTIFNRAFSSMQFWDGRAASLEEQALQPIENPAEMNLPLNEALDRVASDQSYIRQFRDAFNGDVTLENMGKAMASFQRSTMLGNSRVDQFESGQFSALSDSEQRGRTLFLGKGRCASCHNGSNFSDESFHNNGFICTNDHGLEETSGLIRDRRLFKTPTLRGLNATAPFMHDGSISSLEQVVEIYNRGGNHKDNLDSEMKPLFLNPDERADLVNFLRAL